MPPARPPLAQRAARILLIAVVLQTLFVFFFVFPRHDPEPNGLPVAVVGSAGPLEAQLESRGFEVIRVAGVEAATARIRDRDAYRALVAGAGGVQEVLVASAASVPAAQLLERVGRATGARKVRDVVPTAEGDPRGVTLNLFVLPLVITSILIALVASQLAPDLDVRRRLALALTAGAASGLVTLGIVKGGLDALDGPYLAEAAIAALGIACIALVSVGIIRLVGPPGVGLAFLIFLMLGNPSSGLGSAYFGGAGVASAAR